MRKWMIFLAMTAMMLLIYRGWDTSGFAEKEEPAAEVEGHFDDLDIGEIEGIELFLIPPEEYVRLTREQTETCVDLLKEIKCMRRMASVKEDLAGQFIQVSITKGDGSVLEIQIEGEYIAVDGKWYEVNDLAYDKVESVCEFANDLLTEKIV